MRFGRPDHPSNENADRSTRATRREAILWAIQRNEMRKQALAQHGPVRILMRDGKPVDETEPVRR